MMKQVFITAIVKLKVCGVGDYRIMIIMSKNGGIILRNKYYILMNKSSMT